MKHFSTQINPQSTFVVEFDDTDENYELIVKELNKHLDGDTPASERVREDFLTWYRVLQLSPHGMSPNGAFFYANLNTGKSILVVNRFYLG